MKRIGVLIVAVSLVVPAVASADQPSCELAKLTASDGAAADIFGVSASLSGDTALIGARYDDDDGVNSGSAYIFRHDGSGWVEEAKLTASDGAEADWFGCCVSLFGDIALVGAEFDDDNGEDSGSAYIFRRNGSEWVEEAKLTASDGDVNDSFGQNVSISGDTVLVGARWDDETGSDAGSAYIFRHNGSGWVEEAKLTASDGAEDDWFGQTVFLSGDTALVGAIHDDDNGPDSGSVYVFRHDGSGWVEEAKLTAADGAEGDVFGLSISLSGDTVLVGARWDDDNGPDSGSAYIFRHDGSDWVEEVKLTASDGDSGDYFGQTVSLSGDTALVGALLDDDNGPDSGSAYVFRYDGSGWIEGFKMTASDGAAGDYFGRSVSLSGDTVLIGVRFDDDNGPDSGSAYIFGLSINECGTISGLLTCEPQSGQVPFQTRMRVRLINFYSGWSRVIAGRIDVNVAGGQFFYNWRAGYENVAAGDYFIADWPQTIPALGFAIGDNVFTLVVEDVTPTPYNQPPYPPAGDTAMSACTVTGVAP